MWFGRHKRIYSCGMPSIVAIDQTQIHTYKLLQPLINISAIICHCKYTTYCQWPVTIPHFSVELKNS